MGADPPVDLERRAWIRGALSLAAAAVVVHVFGAGTCHWSAAHCDDDDDFDDDDGGHCDDDDNHIHIYTSQNEHTPSMRLEEFELETTRHVEDHPVAALRNLRGISITDWEPVFGATELRRFTADLLEVNEDLLGLPVAAGTLVFDRVEFLADVTLVRYRQVRNGRTVPGSGTTFRFDDLGNLVEIENHTRLD